MNQWYFDILILFVLLLLIIGFITCNILIIIRKVRKRKCKTICISIVINAVLLTATISYSVSHSTYYKYNDWAILQSNIYTIEEKYGKFDLGEIKEGEKGRVAYYIYTDNGLIMPDHLKHYYYMEYDEWGVIYNVSNECQPGG